MCCQLRRQLPKEWHWTTFRSLQRVCDMRRRPSECVSLGVSDRWASVDTGTARGRDLTIRPREHWRRGGPLSFDERVNGGLDWLRFKGARDWMCPCALMGVNRGHRPCTAGSAGSPPPPARAQRGPFREAAASTRLFGRTAPHHGMEPWVPSTSSGHEDSVRHTGERAARACALPAASRLAPFLLLCFLVVKMRS